MHGFQNPHRLPENSTFSFLFTVYFSLQKNKWGFPWLPTFSEEFASPFWGCCYFGGGASSNVPSWSLLLGQRVTSAKTHWHWMVAAWFWLWKIKLCFPLVVQRQFSLIIAASVQDISTKSSWNIDFILHNGKSTSCWPLFTCTLSSFLGCWTNWGTDDRTIAVHSCFGN